MLERGSSRRPRYIESQRWTPVVVVGLSQDLEETLSPAGQSVEGWIAGLRARLADGLAEPYSVQVQVLPLTGTDALLQWLTSTSLPLHTLVTSIAADVRDALVTPEQTERRLIDLADGLRERFAGQLLVLNCSSFDPGDHTYSLRGLSPEPLALRIHRFNLSLIRAAQRCGLTVIDVDGLAAEAGCVEHVRTALGYSGALRKRIHDEVAQHIRERITVSLGGEVFGLRVPRYDRRVSEVVIQRWHKGADDFIRYGEALVEVRADNVSWRLDDRSRRRSTGRSLRLILSAGGEGTLRRLCVARGGLARVGQRIAVITSSADIALPPPAELDGLPSFPATSSALVSRATDSVT